MATLSKKFSSKKTRLPTVSPLFQFLPAKTSLYSYWHNPPHKSNLKSPPKEPTLPTHLLQTVDDKPVGFHNGPDLRRQRAQQLTPSLLFARISQGERGNKINMGVRVRFVLVEPQMDHVWVQSRTRRVKARSAGAKERVWRRMR